MSFLSSVGYGGGMGVKGKLAMGKVLFTFGFYTAPIVALMFLTGATPMGKNADGEPYPGWWGAVFCLLCMPLMRWLAKSADSQLHELDE